MRKPRDRLRFWNIKVMTVATILRAMAALAAVAKDMSPSGDRVTLPECPHLNENRILVGTENFTANEIEIAHCKIDTVNINQYVLPNITKVIIDNSTIEDWKSLENLFHIWGKINTVTILRQNNMDKAPNTLLWQINVKYLEVVYCSLREVPAFALSTSSLEMLQLKLNSITALAESDMFSSLVNLKFLEIPYNHIQHMNASVFEPLTKLQTLSLQHNRIRYVHEKLFQTLSNLRILNLSHNKIQFLPTNMLKGCANLEKLRLNNNQLMDLPVNFFSGLKNLKKFDIDENPWQCACLREIQAEVMRKGMEWKSTTTCIQVDFAAPCYRPDQILMYYDSRNRLGD